MEKIITVLGRQPALGLAELESLYGAEKIIRTSKETALLDVELKDFSFQRLGGIIKAARYLTELPFADWNKIEQYLLREIPRQTNAVPPGKVLIGLSSYGFDISVNRLNATGLNLKKAVRKPPTGDGRSVRIVPNKNHSLNTAQVIHNKLTSPRNFELLLIKYGDKTILAQTFAIQDIEAYAARDQKRPKRDARVGMLPPKLAQIIVNLAIADTNPKDGELLLDPFCGTGVVLQEAQLMGFDAYGTDIEPRMIEFSQANLNWLHDTHKIKSKYYRLEIGDATDFQWHNTESIRTIACETYLGRPFSAEPNPTTLAKVMQYADTIHRKFLQNVAKQTNPGFRMCIAVPAWRHQNKFHHLKTLDNLHELGYTRVSFVHSSYNEMVYCREGQIVGRELVTLIRK